MTKIYLVVFYAEEKPFDVQVFTNKRKAKIYSEYWDKKAEKDEWFTGTKTKVIEKQICNCDFTKELNELQIEELPY